jgi:arylsulfatase A-like enzyme
MLDLYDAKVYEADQEFSRFLAALKRAGRYDNALVILTADHGEAFAEHDTLIHAWDLNQETMRVPLIIHFPGGKHAGVRVRERASLVDFTPTVLAAAGLRPALSPSTALRVNSAEGPALPYRLAGRDLAAMALAPDSGPSRRIYAEVARWDSNDVDLVAVIDEDGYKRVVDVSVLPRETAVKDTLGLWDTRADPQEKVDLVARLPVRASYDEQLIAHWLIEQRRWRGRSLVPRAPQVDHDAAVGRDLKALGYLGAPRRGAGQSSN